MLFFNRHIVQLDIFLCLCLKNNVDFMAKIKGRSHDVPLFLHIRRFLNNQTLIYWVQI